MKKLLFIKLEAPSYSSIGMERAFKDHFEVHAIDWQALRFSHGHNGLEVIWKTILKECDSFNPDIIFIQLQVDYILTTDQFKELGKRSFVINYTEDVRDNIQWMEDAAPHIGLTVFTNTEDVDKLKSKGISNVAYMPVSYNHVWYRPVPKTDKYYGDIIFVGNNTTHSNLNFPYAQERQDMIWFLKNKFGDKFRSYGMGQEFSMLLPDQVIEAYNNCKVVVTQNQFKKNGYMSDRGMNALGCGASVVHQNFEGFDNVFNNRGDIPYWDSFKKLEGICRQFMSMKCEGFEDTYRNEYHEYALKNHSWYSRVESLILIIESLEAKHRKESNLYHF